MKLKVLLTLFIITTFCLISCNKSKEEVAPPKRFLIYDGKTVQLTWGGFYLNEENAIQFTLAANSLNEDRSTQKNAIYIFFPIEHLGKKTSLNSSLIGSVSFYSFFRGGDGKEYGMYDDRSGNGEYIKVIKNQGNNYTIELSVNLEGKLLQVYYTGNLQQFDNQDDLFIEPIIEF